jgi:hypothetical protein
MACSVIVKTSDVSCAHRVSEAVRTYQLFFSEEDEVSDNDDDLAY